MLQLQQLSKMSHCASLKQWDCCKNTLWFELQKRKKKCTTANCSTEDIQYINTDSRESRALQKESLGIFFSDIWQKQHPSQVLQLFLNLGAVDSGCPNAVAEDPNRHSAFKNITHSSTKNIRHHKKHLIDNSYSRAQWTSVAYMGEEK